MCEYVTKGHACRLTPTLGIEQERGRCFWHALVVRHGERINDPEEFTRWCEQLAEARYCSIWTHAAPLALWQFLVGERSTLPAPSACQAISCSLAPQQASDDEVATFRARYHASA